MPPARRATLINIIIIIECHHQQVKLGNVQHRPSSSSPPVQALPVPLALELEARPFTSCACRSLEALRRRGRLGVGAFGSGSLEVVAVALTEAELREGTASI